MRKVLHFNPDYSPCKQYFAGILEQPWKTMRLKSLLEKYPD